VIDRRQQAIGIGRQINPDYRGFFVHHVVDEARVLVCESVVILPPDV
jgi:hypothetical protein